ncbi:MAG: SCO family protein [Flavobacteriaceae bacterium]
MKNKSYIGITFIILIFGIFAVPKIIDRVTNDKVLDGNRLNTVKRGVTTSEGSSELTKFGKVPDFKFINQDSIPVDNSFFEDKVYVVEFFFTTCPTICPIMTQNMLQIESAFGDLDNFAIASFTINPEHDTPSVLKNYMVDHGIKSKNWQMLTGDESAIMALSNKGFDMYAAAKELAPGGFEHSGMFALVDKNGVIRSRQDEFGNPILYYRGITETSKDEAGDVIDTSLHQITELKQDILKLLKED